MSRTNADTPADAQAALDFGAEGYRSFPYRAYVLWQKFRGSSFKIEEDDSCKYDRWEREYALKELEPYVKEAVKATMGGYGRPSRNIPSAGSSIA